MSTPFGERIGGIAFYLDGAAIPDFGKDRLENLSVKKARSIVVRDSGDVFSGFFDIRKGVFDGGFFAGGEDSSTNRDAAKFEEVSAGSGKIAIGEVFYWDVFVKRLHISNDIWSILSRQFAQR